MKRLCARIANDRAGRPGWPEIAAGLATYIMLLFVFAMILGLLRLKGPIWQGVVGSTAGCFVGVGAFLAAFSLRIRMLPAFGFRSASARSLIAAIGLGIVGYCLNLVIQSVYVVLFGVDDPQSILHAAARGGPVPFTLSLLGGAVLTPFGEEVLFRGVIANAFNRYGAFVGIVLSATVFGLAHGISVILPIAIMVGILSASLFRATEFVWPCVVLHGVYNAANSIAAAVEFEPMM